MGQGDEKSSLKPIKPLALRYNDTRRTLKWYKEQLRLKMRRSRLLILAIADKLNEKELEVVKVMLFNVAIITIWFRHFLFR